MMDSIFMYMFVFVLTILYIKYKNTSRMGCWLVCALGVAA